MAVPNRGPELLAVNIAFTTTAILACALRIFVRVKMVKAFGRDDWLMVFATLFFISYSTSSCIGIHYGTGRHHHDLSTDGIQKARHAWYFCYLFYSVAMICAKISIGFLLLRISIRKIHTWIIWSAMCVSVIAGGAFFFVCLFQCYPVSYMWDRTSQQGKCVDNTVISALGYVYSVFSIITDFTFAIIPGFLVWHLQLKRRTKVALIPLITMGCIASAAVIARLPFIHYFNAPDFLWSTTDIAIWSSVEQGLAITAGSLATLRPLFFIAMHKLGLSTRPSGAYRPSAYGMSAPLPGNAAPASKADKLRPDMYKLSATVQTRTSDDEITRDASFPKSPNWFGGTGAPPNSKKSTRVDNSDNDSQRSLRIKSSRSSEEDNFQNGILVSKSFYITDEERGSVLSAPYR
ncbi:hypothetical protein CC77DRAFT_560505 [Alternaria alternata]|uniref:Rhodopsin domain-containing protein n=2 Tax=Alternaria alternata complex TaxID=187734 RepID=A0A177D4E9_ALTAL|nr:hypothetical protein CC77DRAFT_560505 [Alternaria alternata]XP_051585582.1 uncharacterized protein J4E82_008386 [Alternaria postmessia]RYN41619.1 hypothetical protein AA0114_g10772 [Alternaria tenuissima]KAH6851680.1 hypothetical protein B0T12DRAFT_354688 [Alternaria alternata]KAI5372879.1 hypothetical protein J4E82_008386 [Alternaria postmessia]OAG14573.1 hypothetical protein CC77DRAFT_560505 [Alternaria alternata]OWY45799.1 integral membrane protein [Alternaria alternata]